MGIEGGLHKSSSSPVIMITMVLASLQLPLVQQSSDARTWSTSTGSDGHDYAETRQELGTVQALVVSN